MKVIAIILYLILFCMGMLGVYAGINNLQGLILPIVVTSGILAIVASALYRGLKS